jgi:hypothetical protein
MVKITSKAGLAVILSKLKSFEEPKVRVEQYSTDSEIAATVLWHAHFKDIEEKVALEKKSKDIKNMIVERELMISELEIQSKEAKGNCKTAKKLMLTMILVILTASVKATIPGDCVTGTISYWTFDNESNTTKDDYDGNHGTAVNGPVWNSTGQIGGILQFDGINDYLSTAAAPSPSAISKSPAGAAMRCSPAVTRMFLDEPALIASAAEANADVPALSVSVMSMVRISSRRSRVAATMLAPSFSR